MHPFTRIQAAHRPWAAHNFPTATADQTLQGMMEELGELADSDIPLDQKDAVGDVLIYALHHANLIGADLLAISERELAEAEQMAQLVVGRGAQKASALRGAMGALGKLAHSRLKRAQGIRLGEDHGANEVLALGRLVGAMHLTALALGSDAPTILTSVWDGIVAKRDWRADATLGGDHDHRTASPYGAAPDHCCHCGTNLKVRGALCYQEGDEYSCEECHNPDWADHETVVEEADRLTGRTP